MNTRDDIRLPAIILSVVAIVGLGLIVRLMSDPAANRVASATIGQVRTQQNASSRAPADELAIRFRKGVVMLHAQRYEEAANAWRGVLELAPNLPEAHVNMGFAQLELGFYYVAARHFNAALDGRDRQANAYYGLAVALERRCDFAGAIGAMRTFIHLTRRDDPFIRKAEAALWEWGVTRRDRADLCVQARAASAQGVK